MRPACGSRCATCRPMIARATTAHGAGELQAVVDAIRGHLVSVRYGLSAAPLSQPTDQPGEGVITLLWHVSAAQQKASYAVIGDRYHQTELTRTDRDFMPMFDARDYEYGVPETYQCFRGDSPS